MNKHQTNISLEHFAANKNGKNIRAARFSALNAAKFLLPAILTFVCLLPAIAQEIGETEKNGHGGNGNNRLKYRIEPLESLGGTSSRGNSINNRGWASGFSNREGNLSREAVLWKNGEKIPLGTLSESGAPRNSAVVWPVKNTNGLLVGISQTDTPMPLGENWSCAAFFPAATGTGYTCLGFVWENGSMRPLNPLPGGNNSFATSANNRGEVVGWAENGIQDPTCRANNQVLQFRPVVWTARSGRIRELRTILGDSSGAATGINERGQIIGISGDCDQAVGRYTARHAVMWDGNRLIDLGNLGGDAWNTPTAINQNGDVAGFAGSPNDPEGRILQAFIWTKRHGMRRLPPLNRTGHVYAEAYGINEERQVVGLSCALTATGLPTDCRAVIWENRIPKDLNDYKNSSFLPVLEHAKDINERGEITGRSWDPTNNERKAFIAVPRR